MHNPPPTSPPPPPSPAPAPAAVNMEAIDESLTSIWDWSQFLDFNVDDHLPLPAEQSDDPIPIPGSQEYYPIDNLQVEPVPDSFPVNSSFNNANPRVRKRDPRMGCSNFLAGRIPCACPELDAQMVAEEEEAAPGKKKTRTVTGRTSSAASSRCQVPGCERDISELKGYHKRHRVCLRCANASSVVLDGQNKRYCQQCGKFHVLSDFDEGKRSCRRKLERHNNRRRRKPTDSKASGLQLTTDYDDEAGKGRNFISNEVAAGEKSSLAGGDHNSISINAQNIQNDSIPSLAASGETQTDEEKDKTNHSPSYCDDKTDLSSMCTTGRISFKLYDWNPAEFPRRLRHQIFQWLASMPVELEGYIRPGCTILTIFIAMPRFMWLKLNEDPVVCIHDLLSSPRSLLSGRDTFFVSLDSNIFSVMKGGSSVIKIKASGKSPKLHYVQPTCFEAGKPIEFLACGSNLLQPRLRFLVSFAGKYMANNVRVSPLCNPSTTNLGHQFLNICVPHSELDIFGPGFVEVENESGLSNFIPILIADKEICSEVKIMQTKYYSTLHSKDSESISCEVAVNKFSEVLVDMAWLLKQPIIEDIECATMSSQLQRFNFLLNFLIEYESTTVLKRVLQLIKMRIIENGDVAETDRTLLQETVNHATEVLNQRLEKKLNHGLRPTNIFVNNNDADESCGDQVHPFISPVNQAFTTGHKSEKIGLLNADCVMSVIPYKEQPETPSNRVFSYKTKRFFSPRPLILAVAVVSVCCGICAVVLHPHKATAIAVTIHRCLFDDN